MAVFEFYGVLVKFFWEFVRHVFSDSDELSPFVVVVFDEEPDVAVRAAKFATDVWVHARVVIIESCFRN